jgi:undecaprenyl-diphosphatase
VACSHAEASLDPRRVVGRVRWTRRYTVIAVLMAGYLALTLAVLFRSPVTGLDHTIALRLHGRWPLWKHDVHSYVMLGQRGPTILFALPVVAWVARRRRSWRPVSTLITGLALLNLSVGAVKVLTGRLGPRVTEHAHDVFAGGDIFPSGHVSNAVVVYGVLAILAVRHRKAVIALATWICVSVGFGTLYLGTHWLSDVIGGWLAGALVLLVLPECVPLVERWCHAAWMHLRPGARRGSARRLPTRQDRVRVPAALAPYPPALRVSARRSDPAAQAASARSNGPARSNAPGRQRTATRSRVTVRPPAPTPATDVALVPDGRLDAAARRLGPSRARRRSRDRIGVDRT